MPMLIVAPHALTLFLGQHSFYVNNEKVPYCEHKHIVSHHFQNHVYPHRVCGVHKKQREVPQVKGTEGDFLACYRKN